MTKRMETRLNYKIKHGTSIVEESESTQGNEESPVVTYFPPRSEFAIKQWRQVIGQSAESVINKDKILKQTKCNTSNNFTILNKTCPTAKIQKHYDSLLYLPPKQYGFKTDRSRIICGDRSLVFYIDCSMKQLQSKVSQLTNLHYQSKLNQKSQTKKGISVTCNLKPIRQ